MKPLEDWLEKLNGANQVEFFKIREEIITWMKARPDSDAATLRDWVKDLHRRIRSGEVRWEWMEPFAYGLVARSEPTQAQLLGELMLDDGLHLTEDLAEILGDLGDAARNSVPALIQLLGSNSDAASRTKAAHSLGQIGDSQAKSALGRALDDASASVRREAVVALRQIGAIDFAPKLLDLLGNDKDYLVRSVAARTLGAWKVEAARPLLEELVSSETSPTLLAATREALDALGRRDG